MGNEQVRNAGFCIDLLVIGENNEWSIPVLGEQSVSKEIEYSYHQTQHAQHGDKKELIQSSHPITETKA